MSQSMCFLCASDCERGYARLDLLVGRVFLASDLVKCQSYIHQTHHCYSLVSSDSSSRGRDLQCRWACLRCLNVKMDVSRFVDGKMKPLVVVQGRSYVVLVYLYMPTAASSSCGCSSQPRIGAAPPFRITCAVRDHRGPDSLQEQLRLIKRGCVVSYVSAALP